MRIMYITCFADPWIQVATVLQKQYAWEPVYWHGYHDDHSDRLVPEAFPGCIYNAYNMGWKGIFPEELSVDFEKSAINIDWLNQLASNELQALRMMDRMDPDQKSFNLMERQRHFRNFLRKWASVLEQLKPDFVISSVVPHRVFDYALYLYCIKKEIPYLSFRDSSFTARCFPVIDIKTIGTLLDDSYHFYANSEDSVEALYQRLPEDIKAQYDKVQQKYAIAEPEYMRKNRISHKEGSSFFSLSKKFIQDFLKFYDLYVGKYGFLKFGMFYLKEPGTPPEKSKVSILQYAKLKLQGNRYKERLKNYYSSLTCKPDWTKPYIIFNLHYQPEMTSNPSGDIFADQLLCIDILSRFIPPDWFIYVKEHRSQFYSHSEGHTSRISAFYDDLLQFKRVRLLPLNTDPFVCIKNSCAVSTVTGTTGWEAMAKGKPVIIFGLAWYERYDGVLKVRDESSASRIPTFLAEFTFDKRRLMAYLNAFADHSMRAYYHRNLKDKIAMSENECVKIISTTIIKAINRKNEQLKKKYS